MVAVAVPELVTRGGAPASEGTCVAAGQQTGAARVTPSFDDFYSAHFRGVAFQIYASFGDLAEAQDIAQEAFVRAFHRWDRISRFDDPPAWVRRVAWNLAISRWRKVRTALGFLKRAREQHVPGPGPDHVALHSALATLPDQQRRAVVLHYLADMSVAEVAAELGVADGTVKSWLYRARESLARKLRDDAEGRGARRD